jgi:hypothetical protein
MRRTQALTIVEIERLTTIPQLDDVIGIDPVRGLSLGAAVAMRNDLALATSTSDDLSTPGLELWCVVDRVHPLSRHPGYAGVDDTNARRESA